jgi:hypothetical protein
MATDRLSLTRAFEAAGIKSDAAEQIATEIFDAIHDNVATKVDLALAVQDLKSQIDRIVTRLGGLMVVLAGLILAAIRYLPHS